MEEKITDNIFLIAASDYVLNNAKKHGGFDFNKLLSSFDIAFYLRYIKPEDEVLMSWKNYNIVCSFMEEEGYIKRLSAGTGYELTELGREVKRYGGHSKYLKYIEKRDSSIIEGVTHAKNTASYTKWIALATIVTAMLLLFGEIKGCFQEKSLNKTTTNKQATKTALDTSK